jgi:hypothetical protein
MRVLHGGHQEGVSIVDLKRKLFNNNHLNARGGLEPAFRVLFSAIFHGVSLGISIRVESYGIERKQNCSQL